MSNTNQLPAPQLFRYWLSALCIDGSRDQHIRIEWTKDGRLHNALGFLDDPNHGTPSIEWTLGDEVPRCLSSAAIECAFELDVPATVYVGQESPSEMERHVESCCSRCGVRQPSMTALSADGQCSKCWVATMAETPDWVSMLRQAGEL